MGVTAEALLASAIPDTARTLSERDAILYALSVGYGTEPLDGAHLRHIHEQGLVATPTLANVFANAAGWMRRTGMDWDHVVHAEHRLTIRRPLPIGVPLVSSGRWRSVVDRGSAKGMFATFEQTLRDRDGAAYASIAHTNACRGDGGCGSAGEPPDPLPPVPARPADASFRVDLAADAAALYRLNGDLNPLHIDPAAAARGGFDRPILHGLCTFGYAGYAISRTATPAGLADITAIGARFTAPAYPGEALEFDIWFSGNEAHFRVVAPSRGVTVLNNGLATLGDRTP